MNKDEQRERRPSTLRLRLAGGLLLALLLAVAVRAVHLQAFEGAKLARMAEKQHLQELTVVPKRGSIVSRNGQPLAISIEAQSVYVRPQRMSAAADAAPEIARALDLERREVLRKVTSDKPFVWLKRQVKPREAERVKALDLEGVGLHQETRRYYPQGRLAGQALGPVGRDAQGLEGIEQSYDRYIRGRTRSSLVERDARGRRMLVAGVDDLQIRPGAEVRLTLDTTLQHLAEKHLEAAVKRFRAKGGAVVMVDPFTGAVLALASYPFFDPNQFRSQDRDRWRIRAVTDTYEPGSVFKAVLAAAALEDGVAAPEDPIFCELGRYRYAGRTIHDFKEYGWLSFAQVIHLSSNIGVAKVAHNLGKARYHRYIRRFGFGRKTGIDLPGEVSGSVRPHRQWYAIDLAAASFGQSIAVTPMQMVMAFSAIANGGLLLKPYVVERVSGEDGQVLLRNGRKVVRRVVSRATARTVADMLKGVVAEGGTGAGAALAGFQAAGKTGTSQKADTVNGGYSKTRRVASFVGFAPADRPRFVLLTLVDEPTTSVYGGVVAAPLFRRIAGPALHAMGAAPSRPLPPPALPGKDGGVLRVSRTEPRGRKKGRGDGPGSLVGLSMREAVARAKDLGFSVVLQGHGYVVEQRADGDRGRLVLKLKD